MARVYKVTIKDATTGKTIAVFTFRSRAKSMRSGWFGVGPVDETFWVTDFKMQ